MKKEIVVIIHNVRSAENVGSIFRTAESAGVSKIYLTGYTPAPLDRFGRVNKKLIKTSLGAEDFVEWEAATDLLKLLTKLKVPTQGRDPDRSVGTTQLIALEQAPNSVDYKKIKPKGRVAIIVGNEVSGLEKSILNKVDIIAEIPMRGRKESLNVSVAFGIFVFNLFKH
ncbi:MAG: TrmH family RNA methyltransferase [Patescibacteria group bacterium]